jgi:hypothetical protein
MDLRATYLEQGDLVADYLSPFYSHIASATDPFEVWAISWCIENFVPLSQLQKEDVLFVFYERLRTEPLQELKRVFDFLGQRYDNDVLNKLHVRSFTSRRHGARGPTTNPIDAWREFVSADDIAVTRSVLSLFGLDWIYGDSHVPRNEDAENLLRQP